MYLHMSNNAENVKNLFVLVRTRKNSPKDVHQMLNVDLIPPEPFHTYCNNKFALQLYIHSQLYIDSKYISICSPLTHHIHDYF
jgi:hypothetical protein